jgi:hypothetical protein
MGDSSPLIKQRLLVLMHCGRHGVDVVVVTQLSFCCRASGKVCSACSAAAMPVCVRFSVCAELPHASRKHALLACFFLLLGRTDASGLF